MNAQRISQHTVADKFVMRKENYKYFGKRVTNKLNQKDTLGASLRSLYHVFFGEKNYLCGKCSFINIK